MPRNAALLRLLATRLPTLPEQLHSAWGRSVEIKSTQELTSLGVRFIAVTQNIDTDESNPDSAVPAAHHGRVRRAGTRDCRREGRQGEREAARAAEVGGPVQ
jgi:hypothetical protein